MVSYTVVFTFLLIFIIKIIFESSKARCEVLNDFMKSHYDGLITAKYIDSTDHSTKTVVIKNFRDGTSDTLKLLDWDKSNVYDLLNNNDTVFKRQGSNIIYLGNKGGKSSYILNFGCDRSK